MRTVSLSPLMTAPAVRMAARLRASGQYTHTAIARAMNDEGWRVPDRYGGRRRYSEYQVEEMLKRVGKKTKKLSTRG